MALPVLALAAIACAGGSSLVVSDPTQTPVVTATPRTPATPTPEQTSTAEAAPTDAPTSTAVPPSPAPTEPPAPTSPPAPTAVSISIAAIDTRFSAGQLTAPAHSLVRLVLGNRDEGILHNIAIFGAGDEIIARTELESGPDLSAVTFTTPAPGSYLFLCEVHVRQMNGSFLVQ